MSFPLENNWEEDNYEIHSYINDDINPGAPIKVSETNSYRCGADGKGYILDDGKLQPLIYSGVAVTCHDDNLWFEGRSLSFMDIVTLDAKDITAAKEALSK